MQIDPAEILALEQCHFPIGCQVSEDSAMTIYLVMPLKAGFRWGIDLFDVNAMGFQHYYRLQTQFIFPAFDPKDFYLNSESVDEVNYS
jgi:hypothetical protein